MKLKATEHNFDRLAYKYGIDVYKDNNNEFTVFNENTGDIITHLPSMESVIKETVTMYNEAVEERRRNRKKSQEKHVELIVA